jgi:RNA polymerase sigma-70 factor (ECF subfamily)
MRDQELISRAQTGAPGAFEELYHAYVDRVHRHLYTIVGQDSDLDDLVQQTFVRLFHRLNSYRAEASFGTWLHRVTLNVALEHLRKRKRWFRFETSDVLLPLPEPKAPAMPDDSLDRQQKLGLLHAALSRIHPKKRVAFLLYEVGGYTLEEIAELVDAPLNTVAARLRAARQEVRKTIERRLRSARGAVARDAEVVT